MPRPILDAALLLGLPPAIGEVRWSARDTAIYNLGIGLGAVAADDSRRLAYAMEERARAFPTMVCVLQDRAAERLFGPRFGIDFRGIVHGEEAIVLHRPLAAAGRLRVRREIEGLWDKGEGRGAVLRLRRTLSDPHDGALVATVQSALMLRNNGGFGGTKNGAPQLPGLPGRTPDGRVEVATRPEQAFLYRLSGDLNPIHVDPAIAAASGFPRPILMGLCSFAIAARALVDALADGVPERLTALSLRFTGPVFPGETLAIDYWRLDDGQVALRGIVEARGTITLDGGRARISAA